MNPEFLKWKSWHPRLLPSVPHRRVTERTVKMDFPMELRTALENEAAGVNRALLEANARALSERYRSESGTGKRLLTLESEAAAYAAVRMPATFGAVGAALAEALASHPIRPKTLLDVGAGTGAASWAAAALLDLEQVTCLEREKAMRQLGQKLMSEGDEPLRKARWFSCDITEGIPYKAELVIASYVLNELSGEDRIKALEFLWAAAEGLLLLVEPGTPEGYRQLRIARERLLHAGARIAAPCPHEENCPIGADDWCHFTCRIQRSRLHKQLKGGDVPYEDEKFAYLALSKKDCAPAPCRILRHPKIESGKITLTLCGKDGITTRLYTKKSPLFKQARKADCGDSFPE